MTTQRARVQIQINKIIGNYKHICELVGKGRQVIAVVKADAYGHGAVTVCKALYEVGCRYFAVACIEEAVTLRENGVCGNILILGSTDPSYAPRLRALDLIQTVDCTEYAYALNENGGARIQIKVDTGMSRLGLYCHRSEDVARAADEIGQIVSLPLLRMDGIFTHFADSDGEDESFTHAQYGAFSALLKELQSRNISVGLRHCCNSAGIVRFSDMHLDAVRAGLILYGLMPSEYICDDAFCPAMKLIARVSAVNEIKAGDTVSYGCTFKAERDMRVAVLSIGYADGLSRALSGNLSVTIGDHAVPLIGRICMDLCMVDVSDVPCKAGDEAVIFDNAQKIDEIARKLGTINYEVICSLKKRVAIEYI